MRISDSKAKAYGYLGFRALPEGGDYDAQIDAYIRELHEDTGFVYLSKSYASVPEFLRKAPYEEFLRGCSGVVLCLTTLGAEVDRKIKQLARSDLTASILYDACASAVLETRADEYEEVFGAARTYRFCPGYGGSDIADVRHIYEALRGERIGVTVGKDCYMLPSKSMAGVVGLGKKTEKKCGACILAPHCGYLREGRRCYDAAKH